MMTYFHLNLRHYRKIRNMSQQELARKSGLSQQYISLMESHDRQESPTLMSMIKLSKALDICPYALLQYDCYKHCDRHKICNIFQDIQNTDFINIEYEI